MSDGIPEVALGIACLALGVDVSSSGNSSACIAITVANNIGSSIIV